jgi:type IV secretory pathway protease TraF
MDIPPPFDGPGEETYHRDRKRGQAALAALAVGVGIAYSFVRWKPFRVEINGPSMSPTLLPGDWALAVKPGRLHRGDIVVVEHPEHRGFEMVKRIVGLPDELAPNGRILGPGEWWVVGDDQRLSTDSRHFGPVTRGHVKAKVRLVYWPPSRRRIL